MKKKEQFLSEEHLNYLEKIHDYTQEHLAPAAKDYDASGEFPAEFLSFFFAEYSFALLASDSLKDLTTFLETIRLVSTKFAALASILLTQGFYAVSPLYSFGTKAQKEKYLTNLVNGHTLGAFALAEEYGGSDLACLQTTAWETAEGWVINGSKEFISNAAVADLLLVVAKTKKLNGGTGTGIFIVEKENKGLSHTEKMDKIGIRSLPVSSIILDQVTLSKESLLGGGELAGPKQVEQIMNLMKLAVSMQAVGIAQGAFDKGLHYLSLVRKFGNRLIDNQLTRQTMADLSARIHSAEAFTRFTIMDDPQNTQEVAMAKLLTANVAIDATETIIQLTGGYGYMKDSEIERYVRDAKITALYGGSSDSQRKIISKPWLGKK